MQEDLEIEPSWATWKDLTSTNKKEQQNLNWTTNLATLQWWFSMKMPPIGS